MRDVLSGAPVYLFCSQEGPVPGQDRMLGTPNTELLGCRRAADTPFSGRSTALFGNNFANSVMHARALLDVPEPSNWLLLGGGLIVLGAVRCSSNVSAIFRGLLAFCLRQRTLAAN